MKFHKCSKCKPEECGLYFYCIMSDLTESTEQQLEKMIGLEILGSTFSGILMDLPTLTPFFRFSEFSCNVFITITSFYGFRFFLKKWPQFKECTESCTEILIIYKMAS